MIGGGEGGGSGFGVAGGSGSAMVTTNDALTYLKEVKKTFLDQKDKYDMFLQVMKDFRSQRILTSEVLARVKKLFKGHDNLIYGFNVFMPKGCEITSIQEGELPPKRSIGFGEAMDFVIKVKNRFQNDVQPHKLFLEILSMFRDEHTPIKEVEHKVTLLLKDHPDLLVEFTKFLPGSVVQHLPFSPESATNKAMATLLQTLTDKDEARPDSS